MLKAIYAIMERVTVQDVWPDYETYYVAEKVELTLELTTDGERRARLTQYDPSITETKVYSQDIDIPKEFPTRWFVNKYQLTREDGGSEEGGWSWDCHTPTKTIECLNEEHAHSAHKALNAEIDHEGQDKEPYYNVNSPGHEYVEIENFNGTYNTPRRPTYE